LVEAITNTNTSSTTANQLLDADLDTKIQVEESSDEDKIRFDIAGTEKAVLESTGLTVNDGTIITVDDNSDVLTLKQTNADDNGVKLAFVKDSASPADADQIASISFYGDDDAGNANEFASIKVVADDVSNGSEDGHLKFFTQGAGTLAERMRIDSSGNVGIGVTSPSTSLDIVRAGVQPLRLESSSGTEVAINMVNTGGNVQLEAHSGNFVIDAGNVGIGNPSLGTGTGQMSIRIGGSGLINAHSGSAAASQVLGFSQNAHYDTDDSWEAISTDEASNYYQGSGAHHFRVAGSTSAGADITWIDAMTINSTGLITAGTTGQHGGGWTEVLHLQGNNTRSNALFLTGYSGSAVSGYQSGSTSNAVNFLYFINSAGTNVGSIQISNSNTATTVSYNTSSDHRLKENVTYDWDGLTKLKQLKPAQFNFKADPDTTIDGFLAHEAQSVVPEAVTGTHNETEDVSNAVLNALGNVIDEGVTEDEWKAGKEGEEPKYAADTVWKAEHTKDVYQGIDQSKLVPLMVKAIQEQQTLIETLQAEVKALKGE
jgi:hypothetical protein